MALLVAEGFDDLSSVNAATTYLNHIYNYSGVTITTFSNTGNRTAGRYHGFAKQTANGTDIVWTLPSAISEVYIAGCWKRTSSSSTNAPLFTVRDGTTGHVDVRMSGTDGQDLIVTRNGTQLGSTVSNVFASGVSVWISVRIVIDDAAGIVEVRDGPGNVLVNLTAQDTRNGGAASINNVRFSSGANVFMALDDFFIMDTTGSTFKGHLTERAMHTIFPTADGDTLNWTANGATDRWDCVDEQTADDETSFVSSNTPGNVNLSGLGDLASSEAGFEAVIVQHRTRKDDAGARTARGVIKTGGAVNAGTTVTLTASYLNYSDKWEVNPVTGLAWTRTEIDALQAGIELVA